MGYPLGTAFLLMYTLQESITNGLFQRTERRYSTLRQMVRTWQEAVHLIQGLQTSLQNQFCEQLRYLARLPAGLSIRGVSLANPI